MVLISIHSGQYFGLDPIGTEIWRRLEEPKRFEWGQADFVYIPPYCAHQHFNADPKNEARIVVINSRIVKAMGFDWYEQIEDAESY